MSGLVLKVENKNDFHPQSPVNCAEARIQARTKGAKERSSNEHECRTDRVNQITKSKKKKSQNFSVVFLLCGSLLKIDTAFTFCTWHKKKNLLFEGTVKAGGGATKWIASRQNIPFSTPLGPPHSLDTVVLFATSHD